ncbi:hypothetical protein, partial [Rhodococcus sp. NPDC058514]
AGAAAGALFAAPAASAATPFGAQVGPDPACGPVEPGPSGSFKIRNAQVPTGLNGIIVTNFFQFPMGGPATSVSLDPGDIKTIIVTTGPAAGGFGIGRVAGSYQLTTVPVITCVLNVPFVLEP